MLCWIDPGRELLSAVIYQSHGHWGLGLYHVELYQWHESMQLKSKSKNLPLGYVSQTKRQDLSIYPWIQKWDHLDEVRLRTKKPYLFHLRHAVRRFSIAG